MRYLTIIALIITGLILTACNSGTPVTSQTEQPGRETQGEPSPDISGEPGVGKYLPEDSTGGDRMNGDRMNGGNDPGGMSEPGAGHETDPAGKDHDGKPHDIDREPETGTGMIIKPAGESSSDYYPETDRTLSGSARDMKGHGPGRPPWGTPPPDLPSRPPPGPWAEGSPGHLGTSRPPQYRPDLKAGEVDDNAGWDEYKNFINAYRGPEIHSGGGLYGRRIITVLDRNGHPVPNALVTISVRKSTWHDGRTPDAWTARTYADGRTMFFPGEITQRPPMVLRGREPGRDRLEFDLKVERDGFTSRTKIDSQDQENIEIKLDGTMDYGAQVPLDVMFLLDSTGSMADEIRQIKKTLQNIASRVNRLDSNPDLRFGMVSYRDREDDYVTRLYDFDGDVKRFRNKIRNVEAEGGDDYPESLNQALHEAVNDAGWRDDAIRLVFLIADAPPHLDYDQDEDYAVEMKLARKRGIKIFSVASSGLDEQGERIFRQIAQQTMGKFLFILYHTGAYGALETPHNVEQYTVDQLDSLIVKLIQDELAGLKSGGQDGGMMME